MPRVGISSPFRQRDADASPAESVHLRRVLERTTWPNWEKPTPEHVSPNVLPRAIHVDPRQLLSSKVHDTLTQMFVALRKEHILGQYGQL